MLSLFSRRRWFPLAALLAAVVVCCAAFVARADQARVEVDVDERSSPMSNLVAAWNSVRDDEYELDSLDRSLAANEVPRCSHDDLVSYRGTHIRYKAGVLVHRAFVPRLARFEERLAALATETYGRAPRRLTHRGGFVCRSVRDSSGRLSEHALGNALDFSGLEFPALSRRVTAPADLPRASRRAFQVEVRNHWVPRRRSDEIHSRFLHAVADELAGSHEIFRGIVGPPTHRHHDHLHLDMGPSPFAWYRHD